MYRLVPILEIVGFDEVILAASCGYHVLVNDFSFLEQVLWSPDLKSNLHNVQCPLQALVFYLVLPTLSSEEDPLHQDHFRLSLAIKKYGMCFLEVDNAKIGCIP